MFLKSVLAVAALAAASPAVLADDNFNYKLYGKIDAFAEYDTGGGQGNRLAVDSGGMEGTRWGVKGDANLSSIAPGLKGIYQLEGGVFVNNGNQAQGGRLFGRQMYAGVTGGFGTLTLGRQYTPLNNFAWSMDPFGQGWGSAENDGQVPYGLDSRYDNALIYATPDMGGLSANLMVAAKGQTGHTGHGAAGFSVQYDQGPIDAGFAYQDDDHDLATNSRYQNLFGGASYKIGTVKLMGAVASALNKPDGLASTRRNAWLVGTQIDVTSTGQLWLEYGQGKTRGLTPSDKSQAISVGWWQVLTQQVRVYAALSVQKNDAGAALAAVGTSSSGAYAVSPGSTPKGLALGFQYNF